MSDIKLLPCPCCGSETETEIGIISSKHFIFYQAVCLKCGMTAKASPTPELTAEKWNTRKPMDRIVERLEKIAEYYRCYGDCDGMQYSAYKHAIEVIKDGGIDGK